MILFPDMLQILLRESINTHGTLTVRVSFYSIETSSHQSLIRFIWNYQEVWFIHPECNRSWKIIHFALLKLFLSVARSICMKLSFPMSHSLVMKQIYLPNSLTTYGTHPYTWFALSTRHNSGNWAQWPARVQSVLLIQSSSMKRILKRGSIDWHGTLSAPGSLPHYETIAFLAHSDTLKRCGSIFHFDTLVRSWLMIQSVHKELSLEMIQL